MADAVQTSPMPTRKLMVATVGNIGLQALANSAIIEAWPQLVPPALAGQAMTQLVAAAIPALVALLVAYFVPDAPNIPN